MYPEKEEIVKLAAKWENKTITPEEELQLNAWYQQNQDEQINVPAELAASEAEHEQRLWSTIQHQIGETGSVRTMRKYTWLYSVAAVAAIVLIIAGGIFFYTSKVEKNTKIIAGSADVAPGSIGATLTLADGKKIRLTDAVDGELAEEAGVKITKSANGKLVYEIQDKEGASDKINTLSTDKGETYQLRLPDGSLVQLNAASSLTYSASLLNNGKRSVILHGEGYFEIVKDNKHPFVVQTDKQQIEVLGTRFNVMAYNDEPAIATTLLEGSVKIIAEGKGHFLKPNEQALNNGNSIEIVEANLENVTDWKDGDFYFERVDFRSVMRKIARWYDVEIIYDEELSNNIKSGGWVSRNNKLSAVLRAIEKSGQANFRIDGKKIHVTK